MQCYTGGCSTGYPYTETRGGITALIHDCEESIAKGRQVTCTACGAGLVDDDRSPFYDAATDDGTPHQCTASAWSYDPPDPSVGIYGGYWMHEACTLDRPEDQDVTEEPVSHRYVREGWNRSNITTYRLTCSCGATTTVEQEDWAPEGDNPDAEVYA